ncbi:MAG: AMP-binding protein [Alphaproteobacteria bacterium]
MTASWTFEELLRECERRGDRPALIQLRDHDVRVLSYALLAETAFSLARGLVRAGVVPGEPVGLVGRNGPAWIFVRLALGLTGAVPVALDPISGGAEIAAALRICSCRRVFADAEHMAALSAHDGHDVFILEGAHESQEHRMWSDVMAELPESRPSPVSEMLPGLAADAPAMMVFTSGTTGTPKRFLLTYANIAANVRALAAERLVGDGDRVLLPLPLHHVYPLVVGLLTTLQSGAALVLPSAVTGPALAFALRTSGVTAMVGVPRLYSALLASIEARIRAKGWIAIATYEGPARGCEGLHSALGLSAGRFLFAGLRRAVSPSLRLLVSGGARLEDRVVTRLAALGYGIRSGYGLAETASTFTGNLPGRERLGSEGRPLAGGELRIAAPDAEGVGEIALRGPSVFSGYVGDDEANRAAFTPDGWFRTGDLGRVDDGGYLYVVGRAGELIVLGGGKKVWPEAVEKVYGESPFIEEVAVLEWAGGLVALVRPDLARLGESAITRADEAIRVALTVSAAKLPSYARLAGFALVREPLPRTRLGKFRRFLLPALYDRARSGARERSKALTLAELPARDRVLLSEPLARGVFEFLAARYRDAGISLDTSPQLDLGVDSIEWITLSLELEQRFGLRLPEDALAGIATVRDLIEAARSARAKAAVETAEIPAAVIAAKVAAKAVDDERWLAEPPAVLAALGAILHALDRIVMRVAFRLKTEGIENLPAHGPAVIVANHASDLDPLVIAAALPWGLARRAQWSGEVTRLFSSALRRVVARALRIFPADERAPASTLRRASAVLTRDGFLVWFPEAWRSPDGRLQRFLPGIGVLLGEHDAPVIPVHIAGTFEAWPRGRRLPRPRRLRVRFGPPVRAAELVREGEGETHAQRIADGLRRRVERLSKAPGVA